MTYDGYIAFGGNEVVNSPRAYGIARTAPCTVGWIKGPVCETLQVALEDQAYTWQNIDSAPWYDPDEVDLTSRFYGAFGVSITGLHDSTRTVSAVEGVDDGGVIGRTRRTMKQFRVRVTLAAHGRDALDYGYAWLDAVLTAGACGQHGNLCGVADMTFLTDCPPPWDSSTTTESQYRAIVNGMRRTLHGVAVASGPTVTQEWETDGVWGAEVEFTVLAERPWLWGEAEELTLSPSLPVTVQDIPYNLVPYPSAELAAAGDVLLATNYSANPSVEINATGWVASTSILTGSDPTPFYTSARTTELAANGVASMRGRLLGDGVTSASGQSVIRLYQPVAFGSVLPAGARVSFSFWGALLKLAGTGATSIVSLEARIQWRNGGSNLGGSIVIGTALSSEWSGRVFQAKSMLAPATTDNVYVYINATVNWASSTTAANNSDLRLYADALAVTVP